MNNKDKFNDLLVGSYSEEEYAAWNLWLKENVMLSNSVGYFSVLFLGPPKDEEEIASDPEKAYAITKVEAMNLMTTLYRFAYDLGLSRALNLMMMQAAAVERQKSPLLQARLLSFAVRWAGVEDRPLHLLWFLCRFEEWLGNGDIEALLGEPDLGEATGKERMDLQEGWNTLLQNAIATRDGLPELKADLVKRIVDRIKATQESDFDMEPHANKWWSPESILMQDFSSMAYWPAKEIEDVFSNADPKEWRDFEKFLHRWPKEYIPAHIHEGASRFREPKNAEIRARDEQEGIVHLHDLVEVSTIYVLYRNFHHDQANKLLLLFIANLEFSLSQGLNPSPVPDYAFVRAAFLGRVPTILGLWSLDLLRQVMHLAGTGEMYGKEMAWIHVEENKLVARLERGDFMSDD